MAAPLEKAQALRLAEQWYTNSGPYAGVYQMHATTGFQNSDTQWSIKFRVEPDTGFLYFRRFTFEPVDGEWTVAAWSEDPECPDEAEFDPDEHVDEDDFETLEEEEMLSLACREDNRNEVDELNQEGEMPLEELMRKYGYPPEAIEAMKASQMGDSEPLEPRRRKKHKKKKKKRSREEGQEAEEDGETKPEAAPGAADAAAAEEDGGQGGDRKRARLDDISATPTNPTTADSSAAPATSPGAKAANDSTVPGASGPTSAGTQALVGGSSEAPMEDEDDDADWTAPDYFSESYKHGEDTDMFIAKPPKEPKIGPEHQAEIPGLVPADQYAPPETADAPQVYCGRFVSPEHPLLVSIRAEIERSDRAQLEALQVLQACDFDAAAAETKWASRDHHLLRSPGPIFLPEELSLFEEGLLRHGKNFFYISNCLCAQFANSCTFTTRGKRRSLLRSLQRAPISAGRSMPLCPAAM
eukprot:m.18269 g.18269  ORF g.18269 m.18269 type:complete len:469 (-) comp3657_c0_seq1:247-1653(-)